MQLIDWSEMAFKLEMFVLMVSDMKYVSATEPDRGGIEAAAGLASMVVLGN